ncbi:MAG TPA: M15 family metallopeptidase [Pyrinomonadaceae bacterium]|nr:M15 family metallopeptidase [Pyrinomonadaceae bacterium]
MNVRTYIGKVFIVEDNDARVRLDNDLSQSRRYQQGDNIPPGKSVGDPVTIPRFTRVNVRATRTDGDTLYVQAAPEGDAQAQPFGWTKASNFAGGMINEIVAIIPDAWDLEPGGDNYTVTDPQSLVRGGAPAFASTGASIPRGTLCCVTETSPDGRYVRVCRASLGGDGAPQRADDLGWTSRANLTPGWSQHFSSPAWADQQGPNAAWDQGRYIGPRVVVRIVGTGGALKEITLDSLPHYMRLKDAALANNVDLAVTSGFRTFAKQAALFRIFQQGGNRAARPGFSNHQDGQAFDLNTMGFDGTRNYDWLKRNAPAHGFIRTVSGEHWHWEYRPNDPEVRQGKFKKSNVTK